MVSMNILAACMLADSCSACCRSAAAAMGAGCSLHAQAGGQRTDLQQPAVPALCSYKHTVHRAAKRAAQSACISPAAAHSERAAPSSLRRRGLLQEWRSSAGQLSKQASSHQQPGAAVPLWERRGLITATSDSCRDQGQSRQRSGLVQQHWRFREV